MRFFRSGPSHGRTKPAFKMVIRTSKRPEGWDRPKPIKKRQIGPFWYPDRPVDIARDPMLGDAYIAYSERIGLDENVKFLADSKPPYTLSKIWLLWDNYIKPGSPLQINLPYKQILEEGLELAKKGRAYQGFDKWTSFLNKCVDEIDGLLVANWDDSSRPSFYKSPEFDAIHQANLAKMEKKCGFRMFG